MKITLKTETINELAAKYGISPEEYVRKTYFVSSGERVCAHQLKMMVCREHSTFTDED